MENTMTLLFRSILLSFIMAVSCRIFYETVVPMRRMRYDFMKYTVVPAFLAGFMVIAVTKIPPYIFQPVRVIVAVAVVAQIYYQVNVVKNLILSVMYCGLYWILSMFFFSLASVMPALSYRGVEDLLEPVVDVLYLWLVVVLCGYYRHWVHGQAGIKWGRFGFLSLTGIVVSVALTAGDAPTIQGTAAYYIRFTAVAGVVVLYVIAFYYMFTVMDRESRMQQMRLLQEQTRNQLNLYWSMKERYEQLRRYEHDHRNHLDCIRGMLEAGQAQEAAAYIAGLTGRQQHNAMCVNTNHSVVNILLNQKYQEARERNAALTMEVNDLSGLTVGEEDIVTLLGNLLDNAIEACERLPDNRVILFKMVLEDGQLVLSVRNPVREPVQIRHNRIATGKRDSAAHGIGLLNVDCVIRKNRGTSVLRCEDGWFSFSAILPEACR